MSTDHSSHGSSSSDSGTSSTTIMMIPYLHFSSGDYLYFEAWKLNSAGSIVGACIGLFLLAIIERWLSATRSAFERHWRHRAQIVTRRSSLRSDEDMALDVPQGNEKNSSATPLTRPSARLTLRSIPPFTLHRDIPRGMFHALQALLGYVLMLAVMTFHSGFIVSIIVGLGLGEVLFGRVGNGHVH